MFIQFNNVIFRNDVDTYPNHLRTNLKICKFCRNYFKVWPGVDNRLALATRDATINKNWLLGGSRKGETKKPNALLMKNQPDELVDQPIVSQPQPLSPEMYDFQSDDLPGDDGGVGGGEGGGEGGGDGGDAAEPASFEVEPENFEFQIGPEDNVEGLEDEMDDNDSDDSSSDDEDHVDGEGVSTIESIGEPLVVDSNFLKGRILMLPVTDGTVENACCAICHQLADEDAEPISLLLENRLRLNPVFSDNPESFGIAFNYYENNVDMQLICSDCLATRHDSVNGQTVYPKCFSIEFHKKNGNLSNEHADNVRDLFNSASTISSACVKELRDRIADLEKELRYVKFSKIMLYFD